MLNKLLHMLRTCTYVQCEFKKVPTPKTFCNIFTQAKYIYVKLCPFVASLYPHIGTSFVRFILIFNKKALIFLGVLIVFTISSFELQQVRLPSLHRYWREAGPIRPTWIHWSIRFGGNGDSYQKLQQKPKQFQSLKMHFS